MIAMFYEKSCEFYRQQGKCVRWESLRMLYTSDYKFVNLKQKDRNKWENSECQKTGIFAEKTA